MKIAGRPLVGHGHRRNAIIVRSACFFRHLAEIIKKNTVLCIAFAAALISSVAVAPTAAECFNYIDFKTISCLFTTLAVVCAMKNIGFFTKISHVIVEKTGNLRLAVAAVVFITYFGSMLIANDMALLTFLPLGYIVLKETHNEKYTAFVFVMQNIAANLGGMLTPFGNPQNLYLYSKFNIPNGEFFAIMLRPFLVATIMIALSCFLVKPDPAKLDVSGDKKLPPARTAIYVVLFVLSIAIVFNLINYAVGPAVVLAAMLFLDRTALKKVDYSLLLTFVCFFIFAGNMSRVGIINDVMSVLMEKNALVFSAISCQVPERLLHLLRVS